MFFTWVYSTDARIVILVFWALALCVASTALWLSYRLFHPEVRRAHGDLANFTVTNIAVLYAVLLAFIAVATWESFTKATEIVEAESNLAGNLSRDAVSLPPAVAASARSEITGYLRTVIDREWPIQQAGRIPTEGRPHLDRIRWLIASMQPETRGQVVLMQEMLRCLDDLYTARTARIEAIQGHVPPLVWFVIVAIGALTIAFTCLLDAEGFWVHWLMLAGLTTALTLVVTLIVELDYPFRGEISVSTEAYSHVLQDLPSLSR
jgi:hypothetical protein